RTAYPTITWWDSASYSTAAATLGITSPPGSLLLTLLGWPLTRLPLGLTPAHILNLFAGLLASLTAGLVCVVALRVLRSTGNIESTNTSPATALGAALGALTLAFSATLWEHAIKFTPYVLTALFTALILLTMLRWWEDADSPTSWRWLAVLALLFGLDFSVHRTNALLLPGVLAWIIIRRPRALMQPRSWLAGIGGLAAGLAVQLLVMPISASTRSPLNMFEATTWSSFWDYVSLAPRGGSFLLSLWPRNSGFWSVQANDFLRVLGDSFFHWKTPIGILGVLPALAALVGLFMVWRRNRRLGIAITLVLFLHATMTVLYFNIPADYFRSFDRHYLPVFVTLGVMITCGMSLVMRQVAYLTTIRRRSAAALLVACLVMV
ncbi:MAG: protein O-mannosyl-transferase family, partial [Gemmatimonadaceae bacterium]